MAESRSQTKGWDGIKKPPGLETAFNTVLSVSPNDEDCASLERIFKSSWTVIARATVASALVRAAGNTNSNRNLRLRYLFGYVGRDVGANSLLPDPPLLIVTSRLADERLWAEALNLGAWDVLAKPFEADEVIRIVSIAGQHWQDRHGVYNSRTTQRKSATGTGYLAATGT